MKDFLISSGAIRGLGMADLNRRGFMLAAGMTGMALGCAGTASARSRTAPTTLDVAAQPASGEGATGG